MIFNEMKNTTTQTVTVQESQYELGISGALMHVYESECNYNALMKAALLSEMKYYNETGKDLFVEDAKAFASFKAKVKTFFENIIEKIKSIAAKFFNTITGYANTDAAFVKKYSSKLLKADLAGFKANAYEFNFDGTDSLPIDILDKVTKMDPETNEAVDECMGDIRNMFAGADVKSNSEMLSKIRKNLYGNDGEKKEVEISDLKAYLDDINSAKSDIAAVKALQNNCIAAIKGFISDLEKQSKNKEEVDAEQVNKYNNKIKVYKAAANDMNVYFGAVTRAFVDRKRQSKAICIKAMSYKPEVKAEATVAYADIFAGVEIV